MAAEKPEEQAPRPTIPFDYLAVAEELHSGRIKVSSEAAAAEYRDVGEDVRGRAFRASRRGRVAETPRPEACTALDRARGHRAELGLERAPPADFGKLRRTFALKNHPDRVAPHLRQRALARMQVANG